MKTMSLSSSPNPRFEWAVLHCAPSLPIWNMQLCMSAGHKGGKKEEKRKQQFCFFSSWHFFCDKTHVWLLWRRELKFQLFEHWIFRCWLSVLWNYCWCSFMLVICCIGVCPSVSLWLGLVILFFSWKIWQKKQSFNSQQISINFTIKKTCIHWPLH